MAAFGVSQFIVYEPVGSLPWYFGETYFISVGIHSASTEFIGEYHILTTRPADALVSKATRVTVGNIPAEILVVDTFFIIKEMGKLAKLEMEEKIFAELKAQTLPVSYFKQLDLEKCENNKLAGCWMRNRLHEQLDLVRQKTQCEPLAQYLAEICRLPTIVQS